MIIFFNNFANNYIKKLPLISYSLIKIILVCLVFKKHNLYHELLQIFKLYKKLNYPYI